MLVHLLINIDFHFGSIMYLFIIISNLYVSNSVTLERSGSAIASNVWTYLPSQVVKRKYRTTAHSANYLDAFMCVSFPNARKS